MLMLVYHSYINVIITTIVIIIAVTSDRNNNDCDDGDYGFDGDSDEVGNGDDGTAHGGDSSWDCDGW